MDTPSIDFKQKLGKKVNCTKHPYKVSQSQDYACVLLMVVNNDIVGCHVYKRIRYAN